MIVIHICTWPEFVEQVINGGRREVREPNELEADELRRCFRDANPW